MLDPKLIRSDLEAVVTALGRRRAVGIARGREGSGGGLGAAHGSHTRTAGVDAREGVRGSCHHCSLYLFSNTALQG